MGDAANAVRQLRGFKHRVQAEQAEQKLDGDLPRDADMMIGLLSVG